MDIQKILVSSSNTIEDVETLKDKLKILPRDYNPYPELEKDIKLKAILRREKIYLMPQFSGGETYEDDISIPDGAINQTTNVFETKFCYKGINLILSKDNAMHS